MKGVEFQSKFEKKHIIIMMNISSRDDFIAYAKTCGSVKEYLEKVAREQHKSSRSTSNITTDKAVDKASMAFKAIDKDHSGFVDREEFLQFTRFVLVKNLRYKSLYSSVIYLLNKERSC